MFKYILSIFIVLLLSGCSEKIILVPQAEYYPTFPTSDFNTSQKYTIEMWIETEDVNGTTITYLVAEKDDMKKFIRDTKELRSNYNLLLRKINQFNGIIKELNKIQNEKKPKEVDNIDNSWFK